MIQCRLEMEKWLNPKIDFWLTHDLPILDWVSILPDGILHIQIIREHIKHAENLTIRELFDSSKWMCGNDVYQEPALPFNVRRAQIWFVRCNQTSILENSNGSKDIKLWPRQLDKLKYNLRDYMKCDELEMVIGKPKKHIELAACPMLYGDLKHMATVFSEWYHYHRMIGVQHFWAFINNEVDPAYLPQLPDVTYVPYNYRWINHQQSSTYLPAYDGASVWQVSMQNQCLWRLKRYGVDWFLTTDVDEYIEVRDNTTEGAEYPLLSFLKKHKNTTREKTPIGGLRMMSVPFGSAKVTDGEDAGPFHLAMDYTTRWDDATGNFIDRSRPKIIYQAQVCEANNVHWRLRGGRTEGVDPLSEIMLHHIRRPRPGIMGGLGGGKSKRRDSKMADGYRVKVCNEILSNPFGKLVNISSAICNTWPLPHSHSK
jgi:hypothetical protein